jgi:membrane protease YdiL (CAAX protease family)
VKAAAPFVARIAGSTLLSLVLLLTISPPRPALRVPLSLALGLGLVAGTLLFAGVTRRTPGTPVPGRPGVAFLGCIVLGVAAANEEVLWRWVVLGELLRVGPVAAIAGSTVGFALAHRLRPGLHLGTGTVFGGIYLVTGALAASVAAHWVYNVLLLFFARGRTAAAGAPP